MRLPPSSSLGSVSIAVTLATVGAGVLGFLSPAVGIVLLILAAGFFVLATYQWITDSRNRWNQLRVQLEKADGIRTWLSLLENPNESLPSEEDRLFEWAKETYGLIKGKFPTEADTFMGKDYASLGSAYFATAYGIYLSEHGRQQYLESRTSILRRLLRAR